MNVRGAEEGLVFSRFLLLYFIRDQSHEQSLSRGLAWLEMRDWMETGMLLSDDSIYM
jgi:hypothetical protein